MSPQHGFWRTCRIAFLCTRCVVWGVVLLLLLSLAWFHFVGLPNFLKTRLVAALHQRGVQLEFSRMRWNFIQGLICDNVRVGAAEATGGPVLRAREVQLRLNYPALIHLREQVDGLMLRRGNFTLRLAPNDSLTLTNLQGELRILPDDTWSLDQLRADCAGVTFDLAGEIAHAPECRNWKIFAATSAAEHGSVQASLQSFAAALKQIHFAGKPQLNARLDGDARDVRSFAFSLSARAPGIQTPWLSASNLEFTAHVLAPTNAPLYCNPAWNFWTNVQPFRLDWKARGTDLKSPQLAAEAMDCSGVWGDPREDRSLALTLNARARGVQTPWFGLHTLDFATDVAAITNAPAASAPAWTFWTNLQPFRLDWHAHGTELKSPKLAAEVLDCRGVWGEVPDGHSLALAVNAQAQGAQTPWFNLRTLDLVTRVAAPTNGSAASDPSWGFWTNLQPFRLDWKAHSTELQSPQLAAEAVDCSGAWNAPDLTVSELSARLGGGRVDAGAKLDAASRRVSFTIHSGFDLHAVAALLPALARERLAEISWSRPPAIQAGGTLVLPAWTNRASSWLEHLEPGTQLHGDLELTNTHVAGLSPLDAVQTHFSYSNHVWSLPDLALTQGRTSLKLGGTENDASQNFTCVVGGVLDAESLRPFFTTSNAVHGFNYLRFGKPVALGLDLAGNLRDFSTLSATGHVEATDFAVRGQGVDRLTTTLSYSNLTAEFFHPQLARANGLEQFGAEKVTLDIAGERLFLHGGTGRVSPVAVGESIGPKTAEAMAPYQFLALPKATAEGCIPLKQRNGDLVDDDADLRVDVIGTVPFKWRRFETPRITGTIHWLAHELILTNVVSECYGGTARGWGAFDVDTPGDGTDFSFFLDGTNVDFNAMGRALWSPTNQLRGSLSGQVTVTRANSADWRTWNGYGQAQLHNGLLWDAPIFGLMSPVLNKLTPGLDLGSSRATDGAGHFTMTNGVVHTDSLEIRSLTMRLDYVGTVDLEENVTARAKAELLRNTPMLGLALSLVFMPVSKAFECEVTGTLDQPKITPLYIPFAKELAAPLHHPIHTIEKIFSPPATNTPPPP
jgi:hypothetical protein